MKKLKKKLFLLFLFSLILSIINNIPLSYAKTYEDFTTYTEVDLNNHILLVNSTYVEFDAWRNEDAYLYKNYGNDYFENFTHYIDVKMVSSDLSSVCPVWLLSDYIDDSYGLTTSGYTHLWVYMRRQSASPNYLIGLREDYDDGSPPTSVVQDTSILITVDTWYYLTLIKNGTSLICQIWNNAERTNSFDNLTLTLHDNWKFRYIFACNTRNSGHALNGVVHIKNLDIGITPHFVTFYFNEGGIVRINNSTVANGTTLEFVNGTILELASLTKNSSYVWLNYTWSFNNATVNFYNLTILSNATFWSYFSTVSALIDLTLFIGLAISFGLICILIVIAKIKS